jgi:hypothetical protein
MRKKTRLFREANSVLPVLRREGDLRRWLGKHFWWLL